MIATAVPDADALRAITRLRDLNAAIAAHGTAYTCMAHERRRLVAALRASGIPAVAIAVRAGMSPNAVRVIAHRAHKQGAVQ